MNSILQIKLPFQKESNPVHVAGKKLRKSAEVSANKIEFLIEGLRVIQRYYRDTPRLMKDFLIDVNYNDIVAKSKRIESILKPAGRNVNDMVVGARFSDAPSGQENHIITYYVDEETVQRTIDELEVARQFVETELNGKATSENFDSNRKLRYHKYPLPKTRLRNLVVESSVIDSFSVPAITGAPERDSFLITFYRTELSLSVLLEQLGIEPYSYTSYGSDTISVNRDLYQVLNERIPYMISMISADFSKIRLQDVIPNRPIKEIQIPDPVHEPTIGVIDTLFDESAYFSKWVENVDYLDEIERFQLSNARRDHGTQVSSIIVDGPRMNPWLDDGCGRFRVRHFGVCSERIHTARLVRKLREIVRSNPDIHVWNLSLGTEDEVSRNFISYDAAALDDIQAQYNVIFVVSGTNDNRTNHPDILKIASPADSLNSLVVNSVRRDGQPATYTRRGNVLQFFNKPDISYYGGDYDERIMAYSSAGEEEVYGTSFAAPWISRKLCYLIDIMKLPREVAKAMIIDSAAGWEYRQSSYRSMDMIGYGIVPIDIRKILSTENEEIRFIVYGTSEAYRTVNYGIPVPRDEDNKYPYMARVALCYFPECTRSQGVDYTNRELSVTFGRINDNDKIDDINENLQEEVDVHTDERKSRNDFRKWENTKFISTIWKPSAKPKKSYGDRLWGIAVTSKERLTSQKRKSLNFGAVITLKDIHGVNRIEEFMKACMLRGYIVSRLDVENRVEVYNAMQEEIPLR